RRVGLLPLRGNLRQDLLNGTELFRLVINDEVALVAELLNMLAQDAHAQRMERADRWWLVDRCGLMAGICAPRVGFRAPGCLREHLEDAFLHLARGLVREGH